VTEGITLGVDSGSSGTYNLSDGSLSSINALEIGYSGTGVFTQTGGSQTITGTGMGQGLYMGLFGSGAYNLSGTGFFSVVQDELIGYTSPASFTQSGGTNIVGGTLSLGDQAGGSLFITYSGK
jgi:hypothetical protein